MSLINCYNFKEGSGTTIYDRVGTNNGTLGGSTLPTLLSGGGLSFVGNNGTTFATTRSRVTFADQTKFQYSHTSNFAILLIVKINTPQSYGAVPFAHSDANNLNGRIMLSIAGTTGYPSYRIQDTNGNYKSAALSSNICNGKYHSLLINYSSSNVGRFTVDGVLIANSVNNTLNGNFYNTNSKTTLGCWYAHNGYYGYDLTGSIFLFKNFNNSFAIGNEQDEVNEFFNLI